MRVLNVVVGAGQSAIAWRLAVLASGVLSLGGCGRATSQAHPSAHANTGGSAASVGQTAGEGGSDEGAAPGFAGSSGVSDGGRGLGGRASAGLGGAPSGAGTASAGAGGMAVQAGAGGRSPFADLPLPAGCQALSGAATELLCSLDVTCDAVPQSMTCYHTGSGAMQCSCEPPNSDKLYLIEGATGLDACAISAALCARAAPDPGFIRGDCVVTQNETGVEFEPGVGEGESCTVAVECQRPLVVDFAPGVSVTMPGGGSTHCVESLSPGRTSEQVKVNCETTGSRGDQSHAAVASSLANACRPVLDFYLSSEEPDFDGSKSCFVESHELGRADSCMLVETCFDSAPIPNGVSLVRYPSERSTACSFDDLGNLGCGCSFQSAAGLIESLSYDLGVATPPPTCDLSDCSLEMMAEPTGPGACQAQLYSLEYDDDSCTDYLICRQPATLAGVDVTIYSQLNVRCARGEDDAFYCGCAAGDETATYPAGEVASSEDACITARTDCLTHLTLPLGPASSQPAPDPLF